MSAAREGKLDYVACIFDCIFAARQFNQNSCAYLKWHVKMRLYAIVILGPVHTYPDIFEFATFSFRIQTRGVFKSNSPVHMHPMVSGSTLEKLSLHVVPPYWFIVREETGHDFATSSD